MTLGDPLPPSICALSNKQKPKKQKPITQAASGDLLSPFAVLPCHTHSTVTRTPLSLLVTTYIPPLGTRQEPGRWSLGSDLFGPCPMDSPTSV